MQPTNRRAFKEWAVSCKAMREGRQILLIRKGGIREERGTFAITDPEFFLMPTYDHQEAKLLQPGYVGDLEAIQQEEYDPNTVVIDTCAVVDTICEARDEAQVNGLAQEMIWNEDYVKLRFDYRPYDPLYLILLRIYRLPEVVRLPMVRSYGGCTSWITLEQDVSTEGAIPAIPDTEYTERRNRLQDSLSGQSENKFLAV